jgi:hypothetical protein
MIGGSRARKTRTGDNRQGALCRNPNIGADDMAAQPGRRMEKMGRFQRPQGDGHIGFYSSKIGPIITAHPAWHIGREDKVRLLPQSSKLASKPCVQWPIEACPKNRVQQHGGGGGSVERLNTARPSGARTTRHICFGFPKCRNTHIKTARL